MGEEITNHSGSTGAALLERAVGERVADFGGGVAKNSHCLRRKEKKKKKGKEKEDVQKEED